jgi:hypothetical protein
VLRISSKPQIAEPATAAAAAGQAGVDIAGAPGRLARRGVRRGACSSSRGSRAELPLAGLMVYAVLVLTDDR